MRALNKRSWAGLACCLAVALSGCARTVREEPAAVNYVPDAGYHLLMAEIALQRGAYVVAAQEYLTAAERSRDSTTARRATEYSFDYGFDNYALRAAQRWLELESDSTAAREYLGRLYLRRYDDARALRYFSEVMGPADARVGSDYVLLGIDLSDERNTAGVLRLLQSLAAGQPASPGYRFAVARAALRAGDIELARFSAEQAGYGDWGLEAEFLLARALLAGGDVDAALELMAGLLDQQPSPVIELELLRLLSAAGQTELALDGVARLKEMRGRRPELLNVEALLALQMNDLDRAETLFNELAVGGYQVYESFYYLGEIAAERGRADEAMRYLKRIGAGGYLLPAQFRIAGLRLADGDVDAAVAGLEEFGSDYPRYAFDMLEGQARLLQQAGRREQALEVLDEALRYRPDTLSLLISRGTLLDVMGQVDAAIADMEHALRLDPDNATALNTLGYTLANRDLRSKEAERLIRLALQLEPRSPAIIDSMGWVAFRRGRLEEARSYLELAWALLPDAEVAAHLGEVLWRLGERDAARALWQEASQAQPDSEPLIETMQRLDPA